MSRLETIRENLVDITDELLRDKQWLSTSYAFGGNVQAELFGCGADLSAINDFVFSLAQTLQW